MNRPCLLAASLAAIALLATFGIGILVGREILRAPAAESSAPWPLFDLSPYSADVVGAAELASDESGLDLAVRKASGGEVLVLVPRERLVRVDVKREAVAGG